MPEIGPVSWIPALATLAGGLLLGVVLAWRFRPDDISRDIASGDLLARRDSLIGLLREEVDSGTAEERARLEKELAGVLEEIDRTTDPAPSGETSIEPEKPSSQLVGFAWGFGSMAIIAAIVIGAISSSGDRGVNDEITGGLPATGAGAQSPNAGMTRAAGPEIDSLRARVEADPENIALRLQLAERLLVERDLIAVFEETSFVLEREPDNPIALSYAAIVRLAMGQTNVAIQLLERAVASDPSLLEPRIHLAMAYAQSGDSRGAVEAIENAIELHPEHEQLLRQLLAEIRASAARGSGV